LLAAYDLFRAHEGDDWWHSLPPEAKVSFNQGIEELQSGQLNSADEVMKGIKEEFGHP
jgi:hypothetical protein